MRQPIPRESFRREDDDRREKRAILVEFVGASTVLAVMALLIFYVFTFRPT